VSEFLADIITSQMPGSKLGINNVPSMGHAGVAASDDEVPARSRCQKCADQKPDEEVFHVVLRQTSYRRSVAVAIQ
jgi:hypothetical protein